VERSDDLQPWLRALTRQDLAQIAVDPTDAVCRSAFGSLSKRELEQLTFQLLYDHGGTDWSTLGEIADDLAISRTKARNLVTAAMRAALRGLGSTEPSPAGYAT
jgi:DNA-directed RNA polymerase sigma subunit (sigma70/sigma32)